jgi:Enolase C-terminal domain-like
MASHTRRYVPSVVQIVIDPDRCPQSNHPTRRSRSGTFVAKIEDRPLYRVISDLFNHGAADESVPVYAAAGYYYPGEGPRRAPGGAARLRLAVDANGRFNLEQSLEYARALEPYRLRWYEEPGDPLDCDLHSQVAQAADGTLLNFRTCG